MSTSPDTILIVDDEEPVRRTFREWLEGADLGCRLLTAADAESALGLANQNAIDLAILDWNLGAGNDGLRLLEDLYLFNPDVVAIMITGYAQQATPLDAMRMGVRDYLDKNQDLNRTTFLTAVRRQLDTIRPAKRERHLHRSLVAFREAVEKIVPLVQSAAALNDPVPLPLAIGSLFRFLLQTTGAQDGALLVRSYDAGRQPAEVVRAYDAAGQPIRDELAPFARSLAASIVSMQQPHALADLSLAATAGAIILQPFERNRRAVLAAPLAVAPGVHAVLELFDKQGASDPAFTADDQRLVAAAADFGTEMLRQALAERQTQNTLLNAVNTALGASESVAATLRGTPAERLQEPPPASVLDQLREDFGATPTATVEPDESLRLAEAVRELVLRHGPIAVGYCIQQVEELRRLLDRLTGGGDVEP